MCFILIMLCYSEPECFNSCAKGYRLLDSFLIVPEKQFGFKTIYVTSGIKRLLLDSLKLVISLLVSREFRISNVTKRNYYINSSCFTLFHFPVLANQNLTNTTIMKFYGLCVVGRRCFCLYC